MDLLNSYLFKYYLQAYQENEYFFKDNKQISTQFKGETVTRVKLYFPLVAYKCITISSIIVIVQFLNGVQD